MTAPSATLTVTPEMIARFEKYHRDHPAWGSLHIVLEDDNLHDDHVEHCIEWAIEKGDVEGEALGRILLQLSKSQRLKISKRA